MRVTSLLALSFLIACDISGQSNTKPSTPDIHAYTDIGKFCADAIPGGDALGYRKVTPWIDAVLCVDPHKGLREFRQAQGVGPMAQDDRALSNPTIALNYQIVSLARGGIPNSNVGAPKELLEGCPGGQKPLAIEVYTAEIGSSWVGITSGNILCVEGDRLVSRDGIRVIGEELRAWDNFVPVTKAQ